MARAPFYTRAQRNMRVTFVTTGLEHLGVEALSAYLRAHGHETTLVYEARPFSSGSGMDVALFARLLEPPPEDTAARVVKTNPDVVAFTSYSVTHRFTMPFRDTNASITSFTDGDVRTDAVFANIRHFRSSIRAKNPFVAAR